MTETGVDSKESKKTVFTFGAASFLNDLGSDMIAPIWPLFLMSLGADMRIIGFIDGLGNALVSISQGISGYLSDKLQKRKVFVWFGYLMGGVSRIGYVLSTSWKHVVPFKVLDRAGKMRGAPRDALISEVSTKENRGRNFGILRLMDNAGALAGITLSLILVRFLSFKTIFVLAAFPSLIGVILIVLLVKDKKTKDIRKHISLKNLSGRFWLFLVISSLFSLAAFSYSFMIIFAKDMGFTAVWIPALCLLFTFVAAVTSYIFGRLSDIVGRRIVFQFSLLVFAVMCFGFAQANSRLVIVVLFALYGLHRGPFEVVSKAFAAELADPKALASSLGVYQMTTGLIALPASLLAGFLWETFGMRVPFIVSGVLALTASLLLFFLRED